MASAAPQEARAARDVAVDADVVADRVDEESPFLGGTASPEKIASGIAIAEPTRFKPVGTTSIVYKMSLRGPFNAALKPRSHQHPRGHLHEVAAYRIARLVGMDNVPPAVERRVSLDVLKELLDEGYERSWPDIEHWTKWNPDGSMSGAAIYWIPDMHVFALERQMTRWTEWVALDGSLPDERTGVARDLSTMIAFDYLIGNWDRWSGGNVHATARGERLFVRDHNVAFGTPLPPPVHARLLRHLLRVERFSRAFVERLVALSEERLQEELDRDRARGQERLLTRAQIADVMDRRETVLSYVSALSDTYGQDRVLAFP